MNDIKHRMQSYRKLHLQNTFVSGSYFDVSYYK